MKLYKQPIVEQAYTWLKYAYIILYIIGLFGMWGKSYKYLLIIDEIFKIVIAGVLIYFFNPLTKTVCSDFHRHVAFSAGFAIILQTSVLRYMNPTHLVKKIVNNSF
tara:strand:+ start:10253 stop:10570 length:318 start_codon:yes stop_codon:yes gene_type:complete